MFLKIALATVLGCKSEFIDTIDGDLGFLLGILDERKNAISLSIQESKM
jgi:hypothetical protein